MKNLTKRDIIYLKSIGHPDSDMEQIDLAATVSVFTLEHNTEKGTTSKEITWEEVVKKLGKQEALAALGRSAFHWNCGREVNTHDYISFDSSNLFK